MPHAIGQRVIEVVRAAQPLGGATAWEIAVQLPHLEPTNVGKYCARAVSLGLMEVYRTDRPKLYRVCDGWEAVVQARLQVAEPPPAPPTIEVNPLWSVWGSLPDRKST